MITDEQPPFETEEMLSEYIARQFRAGKYEDESLAARVVLLEKLIVQLVPSGYGGAVQAADIPGFDIPTGTYVTLPFDTLAPSVERGVSFDLLANTFTFTSKGVWALLVNVNVQGHNSANSGRNFNLRMFNLTDSTAGAGVVVGVARNQEDTYVSSPVLIEVSQADIDDGDVFRIEVGNADAAITGGTLIGSVVQVHHVSELGALL